MAAPEFLRPFQFELPLFQNESGPASPWNQTVEKLKPDEISERQIRQTYEILKTFAENSLAADRDALILMIENDEQGTAAFQDLEFHIQQQEDKFTNGGGGKHQFPFINFDDFSFPIYRVKRDEVGHVITGEIPLRPYNIKPFASPWFPQTGSKHCGFHVHEVPLPDGPFRPAGPEGKESDGTIILFDVQKKTEYDFWQVTTELDENGFATGGGFEGEGILATGSVARFDATGVGARFPETEPSGSARASGLPYLGGLILPEDLAQGAASKIKHALAFAMPRLRYFPERAQENPPNWVYPATRTEFSHGIAHPDALAAGNRIALNEQLYHQKGIAAKTTELILDESLPPIVRIFLDALFHYGAYLVDGAGGFAFAAEDIHTANLSTDLALELMGPNNSHQFSDAFTPWQNLINFLNDVLFNKLLDGAGLALACFDDENRFRPNFSVVEEIPAFYREQC